MLQVLALDLVNSDTVLLDKVQHKLPHKNAVVTQPSALESYQLNVNAAASLYPCCTVFLSLLFVFQCVSDNPSPSRLQQTACDL